MHGTSHNLNALRALAVAMVVASHLPQELFPVSEHLYHKQALGFLGVMIFFVLTAAVLMSSLERMCHQQHGKFLTTRFLAQRAFRIYPLSIVVVTIVSLVALAHTGSWHWPTFLSNILLVQNLTGAEPTPGALWSLPFELQMYILLPALFTLAYNAKKQAPWLIATLWLGTALGILALAHLGFNYQLIKYLPAFLPGVLVYALRHQKSRLNPGILFGFVALMAATYPATVAHGLPETLLAWPVCLTLGLLIAFSRDITAPALTRPAAFITKYSYGIYLVHGPLLLATLALFPALPTALSLPLFLLATIASAMAAYRFIENPLIQLGKHLTRSRTAAATTPAP